MLVSLLSESTPTTVVLHDTLAILKPREISSEAFNSQYLQLHSTSPSAILACAKASQVLGASVEEIESLLFTTIPEGVELVIEVGATLFLECFC